MRFRNTLEVDSLLYVRSMLVIDPLLYIHCWYCMVFTTPKGQDGRPEPQSRDIDVHVGILGQLEYAEVFESAALLRCAEEHARGQQEPVPDQRPACSVCVIAMRGLPGQSSSSSSSSFNAKL